MSSTQSVPSPSRRPKDHLPALDGLRGIAILLVLWAHTAFIAHTPGLSVLSKIIQPAYLGVDIFFVLSGFLITRILLADKEKGLPLRYFYARRCLRIFPIYYLLLALVALRGVTADVQWAAVYLSNFYFAFNADNSLLRHTWSLAVEEHFYMLWPFAVYYTNAGRKIAAYGFIPLALVSAIVVTLLRDQLPADDLIYRGTMFRAASLALGAVFAYHESSIRAAAARSLQRAGAMALAACFVLVLFRIAVPPEWNSLGKLIGFGLFAASSVLFVIVCPPHTLAGRLLQNERLCFVGRISYGLYLYHFPIFFLMGVLPHEGEAPASPLMAAAAILLSFGVALLSFHFVERPILRLQNRFRSAPSTTPAPAVADAPSAKVTFDALETTDSRADA